MGVISLPYKDFPKHTWANRPASAKINDLIIVTDIGPVDEWFFWTGSRWAPVNGNVLLACSNTTSSVTGTLDQTELGSVIFPGGLMSANGVIEITTLWTMTSSGNNKRTRVSLAESTDPVTVGSYFLARVETTTVSHQHIVVIRGSNSTSSQVGATGTLGGGFGISASSLATSTYDMSTDKKIYISALLADTSETISLRGYRIIYKE